MLLTRPPQYENTQERSQKNLKFQISYRKVTPRKEYLKFLPSSPASLLTRWWKDLKESFYLCGYAMLKALVLNTREHVMERIHRHETYCGNISFQTHLCKKENRGTFS